MREYLEVVSVRFLRWLSYRTRIYPLNKHDFYFLVFAFQSVALLPKVIGRHQKQE